MTDKQTEVLCSNDVSHRGYRIEELNRKAVDAGLKQLGTCCRCGDPILYTPTAPTAVTKLDNSVEHICVLCSMVLYCDALADALHRVIGEYP